VPVVSGEFAAIERLRALLPAPPDGEVGIGDDTAVAPASADPWTLLAADTVVEGVHADLGLVTLEDMGWKAVASNVSDMAAMGGVPARAVVSVAGPGGIDLDALYRGIGAAARAYDCPVVGGDLVTAATLVVTVAVSGTVDGPPVLRSGARPGDGIWVTGPLGASAAGLRRLRASRAGEDPGPVGPGVDAQLRAAHARPRALVAEGLAARRGRARAMIDVSDGLGADLWHVADASGVGFALDRVPVADGATLAEAIGGGEDYQLVFCAPDEARISEAFASAGVAPPLLIGRCTGAAGTGTCAGRPLGREGWQHPW
jgi:thiamine-monophosphate kinase